MKRLIGSMALLLCFAGPAANAGDVEILMVHFSVHGYTWTVNATLRHADTGWDHYADAWRVVGESGELYGLRTLYHPHVNEQPFTRSLNGIKIPKGVTEVYVEAHDKVHGWSKDRVKVDLSKTEGERFRVQR